MDKELRSGQSCCRTNTEQKFWLSWRMEDVAKALGIEWRIKWELAFSHRSVSAGLYFDLSGKSKPIIQRIEEFHAR